MKANPWFMVSLALGIVCVIQFILLARKELGLVPVPTPELPANLSEYQASPAASRSVPAPFPAMPVGRPDFPSASPMDTNSELMVHDVLSPPNSERAQKLRTHMAIRNFLASPASRTPEAREILKLLYEYGFSIRDFQRVYVASSELHGISNAIATGKVQEMPVPGGLLEATKVMQRRYEFRGMPDELVEKIYAIRPTVPYGLGQGNIPHGEPFMTEAALDEYLR